MGLTGERALITKLRSTGEELPRELHDAIIAQGASMIPALMDVVERDEDDSPDGGWGSIHAVGLLVDLNAKDAITALLDVLCDTTSEHIIHDKILTRLPELGEVVLAPALAILEEEEDPEVRASMCSLLSMLGIKEQRIFSELCALFESDPIVGSMCLGDYGDPRGIPMIEEAIEDFEIDWEEGMGILGLDELVHAYTQLEGEMPSPLQAHVDALRSKWRETGNEHQ